jgi:hypothetical protein
MKRHSTIDEGKASLYVLVHKILSLCYVYGNVICNSEGFAEDH